MKRKKRAKELFNITLFYFVSAATIISAFALTGKNLNAYSASSHGDLYKKTGISKATIVTINQSFKNEGSIDILSSDVLLKESEEPLNQEEMENAVFAFTPSGLPCEGPISSEFGIRNDPLTGEVKEHNGIDIAVVIGTPVCSTANGVVTEARNSPSFGNVVKLRHSDGFVTIYAHNSQLTVKEGDYVLKGDVVAYSGNTGYSTGPHLHYEIRKDDTPVNPLSN